jgi:hypothetical protein
MRSADSAVVGRFLALLLLGPAGVAVIAGLMDADVPAAGTAAFLCGH